MTMQKHMVYISDVCVSDMAIFSHSSCFDVAFMMCMFELDIWIM